MRIPLTAIVLLSVACSGSSDSGALGDGAGAPGGGVGFGGAQDIGELRAILDRGEIPGPETLDANGFFNEHYNAPAPATCGNVLCVVPGMSVGRDWLTGAHQATLQLAINTTLDPSTFQRLPMNLVVVVDRSGSMASDGRLDKVKVGLHTLIDQLKAEDRLALVDFDDRVTVDAPLGTTLDRTTLHTLVDQLTPRGATNLYDGLQQGFRLLGDAPPSERQNRVIFLSDGLATAGETSQDRILQMASGYVRRGIGLTTIGVGTEFDVSLMRGLAEQGAGNFYFLENPAAASEVFTEEVDYFMQPIALDVQLEAEAGPGYRLGEVVGSRLWQAGASNGAMQVPAVFIASRTSQSGGEGRRGGGSMIFIHLTPVAGNTGRVARITLSFRTPGSQERITETVNLDYTADPATTPDEPYLSMPQMAERYAMYNLFLGLRAATRSYDPGCATAVLAATRSAAVAWNERHEDPDIAADVALLDQYLANLAERGPSIERTVDSCPNAVDPYPVEPLPIDYGMDDYRNHVYACSTGNAAGGLPVLLAALAAIGVRRRRRLAANRNLQGGATPSAQQ